jgi:hypothetical protein
METAEATRRIKLLEDRYYELHRDVRAVRLQIGTGPSAGARERLEARVAENLRQMHAILQEISGLEDSLLE